MQCPRCGHTNLEGSRFCNQCGAPLSIVCPSCGAENEPTARYCNRCGAELTSASTGDIPPTAPPVSEAPTSFVGGRYEVKRFLGEGGKKKVYLAHDSLLDRGVAFALIKTQGLDDTASTRIRREAQAMGRLGAHPHIVTVFDLGEVQGQPYMVNELMVGGDVEHLIEKSPQGRLPLEEGLAIARELGLKPVVEWILAKREILKA